MLISGERRVQTSRGRRRCGCSPSPELGDCTAVSGPLGHLSEEKEESGGCGT